MARRHSQDESEQGFDTLLERLRAVVERMEKGNLTLEQSLQAYEEGVALTRRGHELLEQAEKKVEVLMRDRSGQPVIREFDSEET